VEESDADQSHGQEVDGCPGDRVVLLHVELHDVRF
jgi:hypothetical protein